MMPARILLLTALVACVLGVQVEFASGRKLCITFTWPLEWAWT